LFGTWNTWTLGTYKLVDKYNPFQPNLQGREVGIA